MPRKDRLSYNNPRVAIAPVTQTNSDAAINSNIIDMDGYDALTFLIAYGTITDANVTIAVTMTHGDDSGLADGAAVPADQIAGTLALAGADFSSDGQCRKVGYLGNKRYVRLTLTPSGNDAGAIPVAAIAELAVPRNGFAPNPPV